MIEGNEASTWSHSCNETLDRTDCTFDLVEHAADSKNAGIRYRSKIEVVVAAGREPHFDPAICGS